MSRITSRLVFAAIVVAFGAQSALAGDHATRGYRTSRGSFHHLYMSYRSPRYAPSPTLPYAPEYGFLGHVPANAIRGPGKGRQKANAQRCGRRGGGALMTRRRCAKQHCSAWALHKSLCQTRYLI